MLWYPIDPPAWLAVCLGTIWLQITIIYKPYKQLWHGYSQLPVNGYGYTHKAVGEYGCMWMWDYVCRCVGVYYHGQKVEYLLWTHHHPVKFICAFITTTVNKRDINLQMAVWCSLIFQNLLLLVLGHKPWACTFAFC